LAFLMCFLKKIVHFRFKIVHDLREYDILWKQNPRRKG
jgi:hypothetical protein